MNDKIKSILLLLAVCLPMMTGARELTVSGKIEAYDYVNQTLVVKDQEWRLGLGAKIKFLGRSTKELSRPTKFNLQKGQHVELVLERRYEKSLGRVVNYVVRINASPL